LDEVGDIEYIVCEGNILYYNPIPSVATTIICIGYHLPNELINDTDTPTFIPSYLHREVIVNKVLVSAYNMIEDGMDGEKVNTKIFMQLAEMGLYKMQAYVSKRRAVTGKSCWGM